MGRNIGVFESLKHDVNPTPNTWGIGSPVSRTSRYRRSVIHILVVILSKLLLNLSIYFHLVVMIW